MCAVGRVLYTKTGGVKALYDRAKLLGLINASFLKTRVGKAPRFLGAFCNGVKRAPVFLDQAGFEHKINILEKT